MKDGPSALVAAIEELRRDHIAVADAFYSCPKSATGCDDPAWSADECSCGADEHNARVDALVVRLTRSATPGLDLWWKERP